MTQSLPARPWLAPLVPLYRFGLTLREFQLRSGLKPIRRLGWPVVSVGNLSTGGSGKTPLAIALAKALTARGLHVDVLSRGYGRRRSTLPLLVDRDGTAKDFGDEPLLIARETGGPVYVAAERYQAGLLAENAGQQVSESASQQVRVHLLDDGFQHRQLARDIDILLLSRRDLTDRLLPAGNLREALLAAKRADVIAIPADARDVEEEIKLRNWFRGWQGTVWRLRRRMEIPPIDGLVAAFCGIARPEQFFQGLEAAGVRLAARITFPDHHRYSVRDLERLLDRARQAGATALLTTEKDRVRLGAFGATLPESIPLRIARLCIKIENEDAAIDWLIGRVARR
jgi:tetraacyldisaccharide 4'-kinase